MTVHPIIIFKIYIFLVGGEICSHYKSYVFYKRSIRSKDEFKSINCDKWNDYERSLCDDSGNFTFMGEHVDFR